ncbi:MAG: hypothetical protein FWC77_04445 [Defluviitaleaceae bacterium]|nr:hypothetical protein [Defluviitaleaceae bacterium]
MFTVIIMNQKTMDSFRKCYPLFLESINSKKIGICRWIESGTTVETAVPELSSLTDDKRDWRGVIVRMHDELTMSGFPRSPVNPYDFKASHEANEFSWENTVPLVRLTQILGGVPAPDIEFEAEEVVNGHNVPSIIYKTKINQAEKIFYEELAEKHFYNGKHPTEILLVSIRRKAYKQQDDVREIWNVYDELESSEFWRINRYPSICRFLFYEMDRQGSVVESADIFKFWTSVMLLALNKIDPSTLQAYKLYKCSALINEEAIEASFRQAYHRMLGARNHINERILVEAEQTENLAELLPDYDVEVPVVFDRLRGGQSGISDASFSIAPRSTASDMNSWVSMKRSEDEKTKAIVKSAEISLDQTADKMRDNLTFTGNRLFRVDKYQVEDIKSKLGNIYSNIIRLQSNLPRESLAYEEGLKAADNQIKETIAQRINKRQALGAYLILALVSLLAVIPTGVFLFLHGLGSVRGLVILAAVCVAAPAIVELVILAFQRMKLRGLIRKYKDKHRALITSLHNNVSSYSKYMSDIATHARGSSFLRIVKKQQLLKDHSYSAKQKHLKEVSIFLANIEEWSTAFYCPIKHDPEYVLEHVFLDTDIPSNTNPLYTLEYNQNHEVPVNKSGIMLDSPVSFVERILIEREELYNDSDID